MIKVRKNILVKILSAHIQKSSVEVANVRVQGILNRLRLNPNFESVLGLDVVRDRIVAQTRGKVPQQHATAVQRPHQIFRRLSRTVIGR